MTMDEEYKYMVCTRCFTYNHANYIVDAMNGFTMQETSFPVVTLIVDDFSNDGEQDVIQHYLMDNFQTPYRIEETEDYSLICVNHKTNPNCTFVVFLLKYNHYRIKKSKFPYLSEWLDGTKYHAICEGDDFWTDSFKLQRQVDVMENDETIGLVYGQAVHFIQRENKKGRIIGRQTDGIEDLLYENTIPTLTVVYRKNLDIGFDEIRRPNWKMGDYPLWLYLSLKTRFFFMESLLATYRILTNSASHSTDYKKRVEFQESANEIRHFFAKKYNVGDQYLLEQNYFRKRFDLAFNSNQKKDVAFFYKKLGMKKNKDRIKYVFSRMPILTTIYFKLKRLHFL